VTIHSIQLLRLEGAEGEIEVACSKGTYVRTLIHDVGRRLETGAITTSIRRLMSGTFSLEEARTLDYFTETDVPMERLRSALISIPAVLMAQTPSSSSSQRPTASPNV